LFATGVFAFLDGGLAFASAEKGRENERGFVARDGESEKGPKVGGERDERRNVGGERTRR
jgi:hypothetical protein